METHGFPHAPDLGDGRYRNPILCADYSDPDVVRDGDDYWLVASSFNCTPGLPVLHSRDLVNWTIVGHAVKNLPDPRGVHATPQHGCGVWAPAIRKHDGKFWIFFPMVDDGIYVTAATDPRGPWSEPWCLAEGKGLIDPCPLWDDDGRAWLVHAYANSRAGIKHKLRVRPMSPDAKQVLGDGAIVWDDPKNHPTCEGPKFHKRNGWYYISAPAGGVATGWQLILRSRDPLGPYEGKIVLAQGSTPINGPHQGAIVDTPGGREDWFVHFQELQPYGRIVHLQPVRWVDDWPLMGVNQNADGLGEPVLTYKKPAVAAQPIAVPQTSDDFAGPTVGLQWQWHANHADDWATVGGGKLTLRALPTRPFKETPNLLLQKFPARSFTASTEVRVEDGAAAGLIVMGLKHAAIVVGGKAARLLVDDQPVAERGVGDVAKLNVVVADGGVCTFHVDGHPLGEAFQSTEGHWIGAKVGVFCRGDGGQAAFGAFTFSA